MKRRLCGLFLIAIAGGAIAGCGGSEDTATQEAPTVASAVPFDRAFIDAMVPHHESAIAMAKAARAAGLMQPELVKIAGDIVGTQKTEIDQMRGWRQSWFGSSAIDPEGGAVLGLSEAEMGMEHGADFAGAADVDQAFASMMIDHHRGAIRMAALAKERGQHKEINDLAGSIIAAQNREIAVMEKHAGEMHHE